MTTECNQQSFEFHPLNGCKVVGRFDGGTITTDGGGLLLREVERRNGIIERFPACFQDNRTAGQVEHMVRQPVAQRVYELALGYEDLDDHDAVAMRPAAGSASREAGPNGQEPGQAA